MKRYQRIAIAALIACAVTSVSAQVTVPATVIPLPSMSCAFSTTATSVKALGRSTLYSVQRDFAGGIESEVPYPAGTFGPEPLFRTTIAADGTTDSCVLVTLSVNAQHNDNGMAFQARIDGKPMGGRWNPASFLSLPREL